LTAVLLVAGSAAAQSPAWEKSYDVSGAPMVTLATSDSALIVRSCGDCRKVHVRVDMQGVSLSDYRVEEYQSGNSVHFSLSERTHGMFHMGWHNSSVKVLVETPAELHLEARTADGSLSVSGVHGDLMLQSSDGSQDLDGLAGNVRARTSDGSLKIRGGSGRLEAKSADGSLDISGGFESVDLTSSDGSMHVELLKGLSAASRIESRDGSVTLRVPKGLAAELDVKTNDGGISSDLPLMTSGYNSKSDSGHTMHGTLNGGGPLLSIRSSDGSVRLSAT